MPTSRAQRGEPGSRATQSAQPEPQPRPSARLRPSEERLVQAARTTRWIAIAALVLAVVGVGIAAWRLLVPAVASCQEQAWDVTPAPDDLPAGWSISSSQYDVNRKQMTLLGPVPADETVNQGVIYATVTCFPQGAAESVTRSADAATAAGQVVAERDDIGEQAFLAEDESGATFIQFRTGDVVVYLASSADASAAEAEGVASAFDIALGGDGIEQAVGTPDAGQPAPSEAVPSAEASGEPSDAPSAAAPELERALPTVVGDIALTVDSAIGTDILGDDEGSRAIAAALREAGKSTDDLRVAQAFDPDAVADLSILAVAVEGMDPDALTALVKDSWLAASGSGVTEEPVTLAGHEFTRIDYGDEGAMNYVLSEGGIVRIIKTADPDLAAQAAAALP